MHSGLKNLFRAVPKNYFGGLQYTLRKSLLNWFLSDLTSCFDFIEVKVQVVNSLKVQLMV